MRNQIALSLIILLAACGQSVNTGPNPLVVHIDKVQMILQDTAAMKRETVGSSCIINNKCRKLVFHSGATHWFSEMKTSQCFIAIEHHDPSLLIDPRFCDRYEAELALALSKDMAMPISSDNVKDPEFWKALRNAKLDQLDVSDW